VILTIAAVNFQCCNGAFHSKLLIGRPNSFNNHISCHFALPWVCQSTQHIDRREVVSRASVQTGVAFHSLSINTSISVARRTLFEFHPAVFSMKSAAPEQVFSVLANTARYTRPTKATKF